MSLLSVIRVVAATNRRPVTWACLRYRVTAAPSSTPAGAGNVLESPYGGVTFPDVSLTDFIWRETRHLGQKPAITCGVTDRTYTYSQCQELSRQFSWALAGDLRLKKGEVIGLLLPNSPDYAVALYGAIDAGLVVTFANPVYTAGEIRRQFQDAGVRCCVTSSELLPVIKEVAATLEDYAHTIVVDLEEHQQDCLSFNQLVAGAREVQLPSLDPSEASLLPYSSGTTGVPKGVKLTHRNLVSNLEMMRHPEICGNTPADAAQEVSLSVLPFFHIYGFNGILNNNMMRGFHHVCIPRFTPEDYILCLEKYKPTTLFVVPSLLLFLASHPSVTSDHVSSIKEVMTGAAPAKKSLINKFLSKAGHHVKIRQGYGMTESSPVTLVTPIDMPDSKMSSCGQLVPLTQAKIVDIETGELLGPHKPGELLVRGPQIMAGYLNNVEATQETIDDEGWLHTGDVMYYDEDHYFYIVDRTKELIKVKGNQVSPTELENVIMELTGVADVAVVGIPDTVAGELPRAFVVLRPDAKLSEQEIADYVAPKVAKYKRLAGGVKLLESIPRNPSGKILRQQLKEMS